jgi:hypothetical protein
MATTPSTTPAVAAAAASSSSSSSEHKSTASSTPSAATAESSSSSSPSPSSVPTPSTTASPFSHLLSAALNQTAGNGITGGNSGPVVCHTCGEVSTKSCSKCFAVHYCSREHQMVIHSLPFVCQCADKYHWLMVPYHDIRLIGHDTRKNVKKSHFIVKCKHCQLLQPHQLPLLTSSLSLLSNFADRGG